MTTSERDAIDSLRGELHGYHIEVQKLITRCDGCHSVVEQHNVELYGLPGNKDTSPGLLGVTADLMGSRKRMLLAMRCAWGLLVVIAGAVASALFGSK